ncbi:MAG: hypothetical protein COA91_04410 [Robiginitomaculum sp.]|nr:MAG: hypothetical protein COA91_04410 [Robiginitomaculum sp.]
MSGFKLDRSISIGIIVTLAFQSAGVLMWGGAAEARLQSLEKTTYASPLLVERMARLEEQMIMARQSLARIERRLDEEKLK